MKVKQSLHSQVYRLFLYTKTERVNSSKITENV